MIMPIRRAKVVNILLERMLKIGVFSAIRSAFPNTLTVLNYHRIDNPFRKGFDTFKPNVSATPDDFAKQVEFVRQNYNVISCEFLDACLRGEKNLPTHAAIVTFDDGYQDNFINAYPILKAQNVPAIIFLTTDYIDNILDDKHFYWDYVAACFYYTQSDHANLPLLGEVSWSDEVSKEKIMHHWIETTKKLPDETKYEIIKSTEKFLKVSLPEGTLSNLHLSWSQVREMNQHGIEFGSHTASHPILTRIPLGNVRNELNVSKKRIEEELGKRIISFAYPNGGISDFSPEIVRVVDEVGYKIAFTLLSGPTSYTSVRRKPLEIRRIFLSYLDTFPRFVSKMVGAQRLNS
jgi:peptidoglycan/xylan/chitin deacetylase (PgdA/CDA1 family)